MATRTQTVTIAPLKMSEVTFRIIGTAPYVQAAFSQKSAEQMRAKMEAGSTARKGVKREARNFDSDYQAAHHRDKDGWIGIPAPAFRNALISACRIVGFAMTRAKLALFVVADGIDALDSSPLVRIIGEPRMVISHVRNETGVADLRARPHWDEWESYVTIRYDADMFTLEDVTNLMVRAGVQVGIGEGRPDSKKSTGQGWGTFRIAEEDEKA